jgi:catalase
LADELADRLRKEPARFRLLVQIAASGDPINDGSKPWPEERAFVDAGMLTLTALVPDGHALQRGLLFTPLNLVGGISGSGDPLLVARNRAYRISFDRRQAEAARKSASSLGQ